MSTELKRSIVNKCIEDAIEITRRFQYPLPAFAYWTHEEWLNASGDYSEIKDCMLGWDVTDFGSRDFFNIGRVLFTVRNGKLGNSKYPKEYAEKTLIDPENQRAPAHFHLSKREDIICRAGGNILVQLTKADKEGHAVKESFPIQLDGLTKRLNPGEIVRLAPGMSVNIPPMHIHQFWGEEGTGIEHEGKKYTISSEISSVCDDLRDNFFLVDYGLRFPEIVEDEDRRFFLCHEYPK